MNAYFKLPVAIAFVGLLCAAKTIRDARPVAAFEREQTKGFVRVALLSIERTTVFTNRGFRDEATEKVHAVPGFKVSYVVEALGGEPVTNKLSGDSSVLLDGKDLTELVPANLAVGGSAGWSSFEEASWGDFAMKPEVQNPKRAHIYNKQWHRGVRVPNGRLTLRITTGFNGHKESFVFEGIPVE